MREILFRGKRIDNGEWVYGDLYRKTDRFGEHKTIIFEDKGPDYFKKNFVDPETVCQYTGLTDKNREKIYENDIVRIPGEYDECWLVEWRDCRSRFVMKNNNGTYSFGLYWNCEVEVCGNLFDNPDLLEVEE